jgi:hypothetical protein
MKRKTRANHLRLSSRTERELSRVNTVVWLVGGRPVPKSRQTCSGTRNGFGRKEARLRAHFDRTCIRRSKLWSRAACSL